MKKLSSPVPATNSISFFGIFVCLFLLSGGLTGILFGQCNPTANQGPVCDTLNPTFWSVVVPYAGCGDFQDYPNSPLGHYYEMPVLKGGCYLVSTCGASYNTQLTFFEGNSPSPFAWRDDSGPDCGGAFPSLQSSMRIRPDFTDYTRINVNRHNCRVGGGASSITITLRVKQNNNLSITSSDADMCEGETRALHATPARTIDLPQLLSGDRGTFYGVGVLDSTFHAVTPTNNVDTVTITYRFGFCSTIQQVRVFKNVTPPNAGPDQNIIPLNTTLGANSPTVGTGMWSVAIGEGTFVNASDPNTDVSGLSVGLNRLLWTISNGPCISIDTVDITVLGCDTLNITAFPNFVNGACRDTVVIPVGLTGSAPISFQWQESTDNGLTWMNLSNGGSNPTYSGVNEDSLRLGNTPYSLDGTQYRCLLSNFCSSDTTGAIVFNIGDSLPPIPVCPISTPRVFLANNGIGTLPANQGDSSSSDNCDGFSVTETSPAINVTCADIGTNTYTLIVQDQSGNTDSTVCGFTVSDTLQPTCNGGPAPLHELNLLLANDPAISDNFGYSVGISGEFAVVGAPKNDDVGTNSGSVYIFYRNQGGGDNWGLVKKILSSDLASGDEFGQSVAISGERVIIAARFNDDNGGNSGSAYIFERNQGGPDNWGEVIKILPQDGQSSDLFGHSVDISGEYCIVGASGDDDNGSSSGSAYVFARNQGGPDNWGQVKKLLASDGSGSDAFGTSVAISGENAIIGAPTNDDNGSNSGSAYLFSRNQGGLDNWGEVVKVLAFDAAAGDFYGEAVSISGDNALVGARFDDDNGSGSGSAYLLSKNQGGINNWGEVQKLLPSDGQAGDNFGFSVSVSGDSAFVGSWLDHAPTNDQGSAYLFLRNEGGPDQWGETGKITASDGGGQDRYGQSISVSGSFTIVGAYQWDSPGVNNRGAAYIITGPYDGCPDDVDLYLGTNGIDSISASSLGSCYTDNCALSFSLDDSVFTCQDTGTNSVLFVTSDLGGNVDSCTVNILVTDTVFACCTPPISSGGGNSQMLCIGDSTFFFSGVSGELDSLRWQVSTNGGSVWTDLSDSDPNYNGTTTDTLRIINVSPVFDNYLYHLISFGCGGQQDTSLTDTLKMDFIAPVAGCIPSTSVYLDSTGIAVLTVSMIESGSSDNCGIDSTWITNNNFTCADTGLQAVTLFVRDGLDNLDSCTTQIGVLDTLGPQISCPASLTRGNDTANCSILVSNLAPLSVLDNCSVGTTYTLSGATIGTGIGDASGTVFNLGATTVLYQVTDVGGQNDTCSFTVTVADSIFPTLANCPADQSIITDSVSCSLAVTWTPPIATDNCGVTSLIATHLPGDTFMIGTDTVRYTATDSSGNSDSCSFTITLQPQALTLSLTASQFACGFNVTCAGNTNGWIAASASGGCLPYSFVWNTGPSGDTLQNLGAGTYWVTLSDGNGNTLSDTLQLVEPSVLAVTISGDSTVLCPDDSTAILTATETGGCSPYSYLWNNGATSSVVPNFSAGNWWVTLTDTNGCSDADTVLIVVNDSIAPVFSNCPADQSIVTDSANCSQSLSWVPPTATDNCGITSLVSTHLSGDTFSIGTDTVRYTATDSSGNSANCNFAITLQPKPLAISLSVSQFACGFNVACAGDTNGWVVANTSGGCLPYSLVWNTGISGDTLQNVGAGTYSVTLTDGNGNATSNTIQLLEPSLLTAAISGDTTPVCPGDSSGSLTATVNGGCSPFDYLWNSGGTTVTVTNLPAGIWWVEITDSNGCQANDSIILDTANVPVPLITQVAGELCASPVGIMYEWFLNGNPISGATDSCFALAQTGNYSVAVTYANGCTEISDPLLFTGEREMTIEGFYVFPNPTERMLYLRTDQPIQHRLAIRLVNMLGQVVVEREFPHLLKQRDLDLAGLSKGTYLLTIEYEGLRFFRQIVIQ